MANWFEMWMTPRTTIAWSTAIILILAHFSPPQIARGSNLPSTHVPRLVPTLVRIADSDLEITGMVPGLEPGRSGFLNLAKLSALPQVEARIQAGDLSLKPKQMLRLSGVSLERLAKALALPPDVDLIDALCTDHYRSHYPDSYISAHHPILVLRINGLLPAIWATRFHEDDPGPYFIAHASFVPSFRVLSHEDEPQVPTNVVRLNFTRAALTYGAIAPMGKDAHDPQVQEGFAIAKQNCLRCHFMGAYGGTKSGRDWSMLSVWAREQPAYFAAYVHNPQATEPHAHMPAMPEYDAATLAALAAYFRAASPETLMPARGSATHTRPSGR